jgi:hypothetical protein
MALKDFHKHTEDNIIFYRKGYLEILIGENVEGTWQVLIEYIQQPQLRKNFKTKSTALKFARAYMRSH